MNFTYLCLLIITLALAPWSSFAKELDLKVLVRIDGKDLRLRNLLQDFNIYLVDGKSEGLSPRLVHPTTQSQSFDAEALSEIEATFGGLHEGIYTVRCSYVGASLSSKIVYFSKEVSIRDDQIGKQIEVKLPLNLVNLSVELGESLREWVLGGRYKLFLEFYSTSSDEFASRSVDMNILMSKRKEGEKLLFEIALPMIADGRYFAKVNAMPKQVDARSKVSATSIVQIKGGRLVGDKVRFNSEKR